EYAAIQALAAAARVLKGYNDTLAQQSLQAAEELYKLDRDNSNRWATAKINAAVELFVTTGSDRYKNDLLAMEEQIANNIGSVGYSISRIINKPGIEAIRASLTPAFQKLQLDLADRQ